MYRDAAGDVFSAERIVERWLDDPAGLHAALTEVLGEPASDSWSSECVRLQLGNLERASTALQACKEVRSLPDATACVLGQRLRLALLMSLCVWGGAAAAAAVMASANVRRHPCLHPPSPACAACHRSFNAAAASRQRQVLAAPRLGPPSPAPAAACAPHQPRLVLKAAALALSGAPLLLPLPQLAAAALVHDCQCLAVLQRCVRVPRGQLAVARHPSRMWWTCLQGAEAASGPLAAAPSRGGWQRAAPFAGGCR